jgi:hypothetical protein
MPYRCAGKMGSVWRRLTAALSQAAESVVSSVDRTSTGNAFWVNGFCRQPDISPRRHSRPNTRTRTAMGTSGRIELNCDTRSALPISDIKMPVIGRARCLGATSRASYPLAA